MKVIKEKKEQGNWIDAGKFINKTVILPPQKQAVLKDIAFLAPRCERSRLARNWMSKNLAYLKRLEERPDG